MSSRGNKIKPLPPVGTQLPTSDRRRSRHSVDEKGDERSKKRAKVAKDNVEVLGTGHAEDESANLNDSSALFVPDFECSDGHVITTADSLAENPLLAMTLLKGLALPKDIETCPMGRPIIWPSCASSLQRYNLTLNFPL